MTYCHNCQCEIGFNYNDFDGGYRNSFCSQRCVKDYQNRLVKRANIWVSQLTEKERQILWDLLDEPKIANRIWFKYS